MSQGQKERHGHMIAQNLTVEKEFITTDPTSAMEAITADSISFVGGSPSSHVINLEGLTLPASSKIGRAHV